MEGVPSFQQPVPWELFNPSLVTSSATIGSGDWDLGTGGAHPQPRDLVCYVGATTGKSGEEFGDDFAVDVGEAEVAALEAVGEAGVIEAEEVEEGGVEVVDVDGVAGGVEAEVVGFAMGMARLHAAAGEEHGEAVGMMVATIVSTLDHGRPTELTAPDDEGVVEESPLAEIADEGGGGAIGVGAVALEVADEVAVLIPGFVEDLDEADVAFNEATREEAGVGEGGFAGFGAVGFEGGLGFAGEVHQVGGGRLHAVGHLEGGDARGDLGVADGAETLLVEPVDDVEGIALGGVVDALGIAEEEDGFGAGAEEGAAVGGGEEPGAPVGGSAGGTLAASGEDDVGGEIAGFATEPVGGPGAEGRAAELLGTGVEEDLGGGVVEGVRVHRLHDAEFVGDGGDVGDELGEFGSGAAVAGELEAGSEEGGVRVDEGGPVTLEEFGGGKLAVPLRELGLVVEQLEMAGCAGHEEEDDALGAGSEMGLARREGIQRGGGSAPAGLGGGGRGFREEGVEGDAGESDAALAEEPAAGKELAVEFGGFLRDRDAVHGGVVERGVAVMERWPWLIRG